eukprot:TRINITY_DN236_c0_g1_i31.p1 TRINITY_DN236_c0_g1~~TRINITY_DN236_c0_g1_i31.p1  ORF type:complete len:1303 (+),score=262.43 TRINITY_DN236_c0_g1_i31:316-3909(+)
MEGSESRLLFDATWEFELASGSLRIVPLNNMQVKVNNLERDPYEHDQQHHFWIPGVEASLDDGMDLCPSLFDRLWSDWNGIVTIGSSCQQDHPPLLQTSSHSSYSLSYYVSERPVVEFPHLNKRSSDPTIYYVTPNGYGDGLSRTNPCQLANIPWNSSPEGGGIVFLQIGIHSLSGPLNITSGWTLEGNFDTFWNKIITASATTIQVFSTMLRLGFPELSYHVVGFNIENVANISIEDVVVQVTMDVSPEVYTVYAFRIANSSNIRIERVQVITPDAGSFLGQAEPLPPVHAAAGCNGDDDGCFGRGGIGASSGGQGGFPNQTNSGLGFPGVNSSTARGGVGGLLSSVGATGGKGADANQLSPVATAIYSSYFFPSSGTQGRPGSSGAGGGGGGSSGSPNCTPYKGGGGGGGAGGIGGDGGYGGSGGGGNFGVYIWKCVGCTLTDVYNYTYPDPSMSTLGRAGYGEDGTLGADGGKGGEGGFGGVGANGCQGGAGGNGGDGGKGGPGQSGSDGVSLLYYPTNTPYTSMTGYLTSPLTFSIASQFCTNSAVVMTSSSTSLTTWNSPNIMSTISPDKSLLTNDTSVSLSFPFVGSYGIIANRISYQNLFTIAISRTLPTLHNITIVNNTAVIIIFDDPMGDFLLFYEFYESTTSGMQLVQSVRDYSMFAPYLTLNANFYQPIPKMYFRVQFSNYGCGPSDVIWIPIVPQIVNPLCQDIYNGAANCIVDGDNNVHVPSSLTYVNANLTIPYDSGLVVEGNLTLTPNVTVQFENAETSTDGNLTRSVIVVQGTLYASGTLRVTVSPELDVDRDYFIIFCLFENMEGDFDLNVEVGTSHKRATLCGQGTPNRTSTTYGATVRISPCLEEADPSSSANQTTKVIIIVCVIGALVFLGIVLVVVILIVRRSHRFMWKRESRVELALLKGNVIVEKKIGEGQFGEVFRGTWDGNTVAMKKMKEDDAEDFVSEMATLSKVVHPHVVQYFGMVRVEEQVYLMMEYMSLGSVKSGMKMLDGNVRSMLDVAAQSAAGMIHLHDKGILHRDLALRNILFANAGSGFVAKVADFGMSRVAEKGHYSSIGGKIAVKWAAPEVLDHHQFSKASDVWAFGVTLWELFSNGSDPYPGMTMSETNERVPEGHRMTPPTSCPQQIQKLILQMWETDPSHRPSFHKICDALSNARDQCNMHLQVHSESKIDVLPDQYQ